VAASLRDRPFQYALLASLALHAALLVTFPDLRPAMTQAVESVPLIARLLDLQPAPVPAPAPAPPEEKKKMAPRAEPRPSPAPAPLSLPQPAPVPVPMPAVPDPTPPAPPMPIEAPVVAPPVAAGPPSQAATPPASAPAADARSADQYRMQLVETARRIKEGLRYPPQARENGWEGDVLLGVVISASGRPAITVRRSSKFDVLDRQAIEILRLAAREVPLPPALQGRESTLKDLSFEYRLKD
jgi:protein TonB